jgi:hypothetical protein
MSSTPIDLTLLNSMFAPIGARLAVADRMGQGPRAGGAIAFNIRADRSGE